MKALVFDEALRIAERDVPKRRSGEALVRVRLAGICNTDLEITKGYMRFSGVLGHEFVGEVEACSDAGWVGRRVVGEINVGCRECTDCRSGRERHCRGRSVLGILGKDGCFAEYITLPVKNLVGVPDSVPDEAAVFVEPLAAACEILEQVSVGPTQSVAVMGDGKLGQLVARVLRLTGCRLAVYGKHPEKLRLLDFPGVVARLAAEGDGRRYDAVVDATGSAGGFEEALDRVRPGGRLILKSTTHESGRFHAAKIVVDEIRIVGSRCGPFEPALRLLESGLVDVKSLVTGEYPLDDGIRAFEDAAAPSCLKILLRME